MLRGEAMSGDERRRYARYRAPEGVYAAMPDFAERVGPVRNISRGGLLFQYLADENPPGIEAVCECKEGRITVFLSGQGFILRDVSCRMVHDMPADEPTSLAVGYNVRLCGIQFVDLPECFAQRLDVVMSHCPELDEGDKGKA